MEIPVYLFTGFLDAGKTKFIQHTLEDERFNQGESTLLLLCEEGEEEYAPDKFAGKRVFLAHIESPEQLQPAALEGLCKKHACERVIVEYNGMWPLDALYDGMPLEWTVYQEFCFLDARSFFPYHTNLREKLLDKVKSCELLVLNRAPEGFNELQVHKIVRSVNRRCEIAYEDADGQVRYDMLPDELPFDRSAPTLEIAQENFAAWYRDLSEEMEEYAGKIVRFVGCVLDREDLPENTFIVGRQIMTCCADDLSFAGVLAVWKERATLKQHDWVHVTAKIALRQNKIYGRRGPVLSVLSIEHCAAPEQQIATFY